MGAKKLWQSYLIKWSDGEKRQDEEAEVVANHTEEKNVLENQKR